MDQRIAANNESRIIAGLRSMGNAEAARLLNCTESTISELSGPDKYKLNLQSVAMLLARMGLKIVKANQVCCDRKKLETIITLAQLAAHDITVEKLEWED